MGKKGRNRSRVQGTRQLRTLDPPSKAIKKRRFERFRSDSAFRFRTGLGALVLAAILMYSPIFAGRVPFPADVIVNFPPWDAQTRACCHGLVHAEQGDLATQVYPWHFALGQALRNGVIPLWNPQMLMGTPFLAEPVYAVFFPLNWLNAILDPAIALAVLAILRTAIISVTMALFVRQLGASQAGAMMSGFTLALSGWYTAWGGWSHVDSAMWLPLICLSIDSLARAVSARAIAVTSVSMALVVLAGHPEVAFQVILVASTYALYRLFPLRKQSTFYFGSFAIAAIVSVMLAAVQLLPTLEWLTLIDRSLMGWGGFPIRNILAFISRDLFGNPNVDHVPIPNGAGYVGALALAVLPFLWLWPKKRDVIYFAGLVVACLGIVYQVQPFYWVSQHTPVLSGLPNTRFLCEADFGLAVLSGLGISALQARCAAFKTRGLGIALAIPAIAACFYVVALRVEGKYSVSFRYNLLVIASAFLLTIVAYLPRISARHFLLCAAVLLAGDLGTFAFGRTPFVRVADVFPPNATFDFLREKAGESWRVAAIDLTYAANSEMPYGLSTPGGYDFPLRRTAELLSVLSSHPTVINFDSGKLVRGPHGLLDLTSARFLVATDWNSGQHDLASQPERFRPIFHDTPNRVWVFENPSALPLAFLAPKDHAKIVPDEQAQRKQVLAADFDPRRTVILPAEPARFAGRSSPAQPDSVQTVSRNSNEFDIEASADQDSFLVLNEADYPGWSASVDGQPAQVLRTNYAFMSVPIATGTHTIKVRLESTSFRVGAALSLLGVIICAALFAFPAIYSRSAL